MVFASFEATINMVDVANWLATANGKITVLLDYIGGFPEPSS